VCGNFRNTKGAEHKPDRQLRALDRAFRDPKLDNRLSCLGSALGLMAEVFRNRGPELAGWCGNVLEVPPRRLAHHLDALADALFLAGRRGAAATGSGL
jgi:hypothetical protein